MPPFWKSCLPKRCLPCPCPHLRTGGYFLEGDFPLWEISPFYFVRNFQHNFQAAVRNKLVLKFGNIAGCSIASAKHSFAFVDGVWSNSVGTNSASWNLLESPLEFDILRLQV